MNAIVTHIGQGGRVVIPAEYRRVLGLKPGDRVLLSLEDGELRILTPRQAVRAAQAAVRQHIPPERLLSEELMAERRAELDRE